MKFFFFLFFLINLQQSLGKIFTFESSPKYYLPFISLSFSEKEGGQILPVNTQIQLSWLNYVDSKCGVSDIMNHAFVCSSTIFYDSKPLVDLPFHSYKDSIRVEDKKSGLSMAFKYNNDSYSLMNKLQNLYNCLQNLILLDLSIYLLKCLLNFLDVLVFHQNSYFQN